VFGTVTAFSMPDVVYEGLRALAVVIGALGGWFIGGPLARGLVKLAFHKTLPQGGQFLARLLFAAAAGLLIYFYLPLGPGSGGGGSGTGGGIGDGTGSGTAANDKGDPRKTSGPGQASGDKAKPGNLDIPPDALPIEVFGGKRDERRFYRLLGKDMNLDEVDRYLGDNKGRWKEIYIVLSKENAPVELAGAPKPITNLKDLVVRTHRLLWKEIHVK
jgi:hypothetical protein